MKDKEMLNELNEIFHSFAKWLLLSMLKDERIRKYDRKVITETIKFFEGTTPSEEAIRTRLATQGVANSLVVIVSNLMLLANDRNFFALISWAVENIRAMVRDSNQLSTNTMKELAIELYEILNQMERNGASQQSIEKLRNVLTRITK
jgi:hypothetical protein